MIHRFTIAEEACDLVHITDIRHGIVDLNNPTPEEVFGVLTESNRMVLSYSVDHPVFAALRIQLEELGFIHITHNSWNGDQVTKPFYLNEKLFKKDDRFLCAAAMRYVLKWKR